ncbi:Zinc finger and BTB domain-containing protein 16-A [Eumeta japonica]|uniref:Zinc finger and BTB domain-containing protein 16-A n=1 Tax=Eumeta variegata TaxID=151549 RepID=A0A4C1YGR3_EUMVA|nr:Zinc finger and BTB domain-containing protein 16-A [Eumeta japonica]
MEVRLRFWKGKYSWANPASGLGGQVRFFKVRSPVLHSYNIEYTIFRGSSCPSLLFPLKSALSRHVLRHSSANKTQKCELCNMSFFDKYQLQHHMRVHTGERPYRCEICSQPYSYKHDFNRHCFKKHGVFLKRRSVHVMNQDVLVKERALMKEVVLRARGVLSDGQPVNPFKGPQAVQAYQQALQALQNRQITIDI